MEADASKEHYFKSKRINKNFRISEVKDKSNIELSRMNLTNNGNENRSA